MSVTGEVGNSGRRIQAGQKETEDEESDAGEADEQWAEGFTFNEDQLNQFVATERSKICI